MHEGGKEEQIQEEDKLMKERMRKRRKGLMDRKEGREKKKRGKEEEMKLWAQVVFRYCGNDFRLFTSRVSFSVGRKRGRKHIFYRKRKKRRMRKEDGYNF